MLHKHDRECLTVWPLSLNKQFYESFLLDTLAAFIPRKLVRPLLFWTVACYSDVILWTRLTWWPDWLMALCALCHHLGRSVMAGLTLCSVSPSRPVCDGGTEWWRSVLCVTITAGLCPECCPYLSERDWCSVRSTPTVVGISPLELPPVSSSGPVWHPWYHSLIRRCQ